MTINNPALYMQGIWDWAILDGCFGTTRIKPTDVDGLVERNGMFLVLETKAPGAHLPEGQAITFKALVRKAGAVVIVVWGEQNRVQKTKVFSRKYPDGLEETANNDRLRELVSGWFAMANAHKDTP